MYWQLGTQILNGPLTMALKFLQTGTSSDCHISQLAHTPTAHSLRLKSPNCRYAFIIFENYFKTITPGQPQPPLHSPKPIQRGDFILQKWWQTLQSSQTWLFGQSRWQLSFVTHVSDFLSKTKPSGQVHPPGHFCPGIKSAQIVPLQSLQQSFLMFINAGKLLLFKECISLVEFYGNFINIIINWSLQSVQIWLLGQVGIGQLTLGIQSPFSPRTKPLSHIHFATQAILQIWFSFGSQVSSQSEPHWSKCSLAEHSWLS